MSRFPFYFLALLLASGFVSSTSDALAQQADPGAKAEAKAEPVEPREPVAEKPLPPTKVMVRITSKPEGAEIWLDGAPLDPREPGVELSFGEHEVRALGKASGWARMVGAWRFSLSAPEELGIQVDLNQRERFYRGKWLPEVEALRLEEADYRAARIDRPVALKLAASDQILKALRASGLTAAQMHAAMRIGDRIEITITGRSWKLWKRHAEIDTAFVEAVAALQRGRPAEDLFKDHGGMHAAEASLAEASLPALAFALHTARVSTPHLDLVGAQLPAIGESIARATADGAITVVAQADGQFGVQGLELKKIGDLYVGVASPGDGAIRIEWNKQPKRLLVIADHAKSPSTDEMPATLKMGEKRIISIVRDRNVESIVRITSGPEYDEVRRETIRREGPLAAQIDLSKDEIGPNKVPGEYHRIWVVKLGGVGGTQRQINAKYRVTSSEKGVEGDAFLRRGGASGK